MFPPRGKQLFAQMLRMLLQMLLLQTMQMLRMLKLGSYAL